MQPDARNACYINEGSVTLPSGYTDRTVNVFTTGGSESPFALNIARDTPEAGESLSDYVRRQVGLLEKNLRKYRVSQHSVTELGELKIPAEIIEATYMADSRQVWQRQLAIFHGERVLIFTATATAAFTAQQNADWEQWVSSFRPGARDHV